VENFNQKRTLALSVLFLVVLAATEIPEVQYMQQDAYNKTSVHKQGLQTTSKTSSAVS
jgi:hypothetical protein